MSQPGFSPGSPTSAGHAPEQQVVVAHEKAEHGTALRVVEAPEGGPAEGDDLPRQGGAERGGGPVHQQGPEPGGPGVRAHEAAQKGVADGRRRRGGGTVHPERLALPTGAPACVPARLRTSSWTCAAARRPRKISIIKVEVLV